MKYTCYLVIIVLAMISCNDKNHDLPQGDHVNLNNQDSINKQKFDSSFQELSKLYSFDKGLIPEDKKSFSNAYKLLKTVYVPEFKGLTFSYFEFGQFSDAYSPAVYIYNDTFQFVLPFTDFQYYKWKEMKGNESLDITSHLSLNKEFYKLVSSLNLKEYSDVECLLYNIMSFFKAEKISTDNDFAVFNIRSNECMEKNAKNISCKQAIVENINTVKSKYNKGDIIFSNGALTTVFSISKDFKINTTVLNPACIHLFKWYQPY